MKKNQEVSTAEIKLQRRAYTVSEFLAGYGISRTRAYVEINAGRLIARRIGGRTIITRDDAEAWLASLPTHRPAGLVQHGRFKPRSHTSGAVCREAVS